MSTTSLWAETSRDLHDPESTRAIATTTMWDVCIIGAGITGIATAFELARKGVRVIVVDDGPIGGGETSRTTAHLASAVDDRFTELESIFGEASARHVAESHAAAIDWIELVARELEIDCDFQRVDGYLFAGPERRADRALGAELAAAQRAGLDVEWVDAAPLPFASGPALRFARQAELHPLRFLRGLAAAAAIRGAVIHTGTRVESITSGEPTVAHLADGRSIRCRAAIDATNGAFSSRMNLPLRTAAYRSYVVGFDVPVGAIPHALYWDMQDPYHYLRVAAGMVPNREVLLVGGDDHRVGQGDEGTAFAMLDAWARRWMPQLGDVTTRWSGQVLEPADSLAYIGRHPTMEHVYVATGDSGNGLTHGVIAALLLPDLIAGRRSAWGALYDPSRGRHREVGTQLLEAARSIVPYTDWLRPAEAANLADIPRGEGATVRHGLRVIATYRDETGAVHECSAVCPHAGGLVRWNAVEQTWDCPCHGSRFDPYGRVLNGPAATDLAPRHPAAHARIMTEGDQLEAKGVSSQRASKPAGPS